MFGSPVCLVKKQRLIFSKFPGPSLVAAHVRYFCPARLQVVEEAIPAAPLAAICLTVPSQPRGPACPPNQSLHQLPHLPPLLFTASASLSRSTHQPTIRIPPHGAATLEPKSCKPRAPFGLLGCIGATGASQLLQPTGCGSERWPASSVACPMAWLFPPPSPQTWESSHHASGASGHRQPHWQQKSLNLVYAVDLGCSRRTAVFCESVNQSQLEP